MKKSFILVLLILAAFSTAVFPEPDTSELNVPGLQSAVTVKYDSYGIPGIFADNLHDATFAQGYIHAKDRLFHMDVNRRRSTGREAEMFGKGRVGSDYRIHLARLPEVSQQAWDDCQPIECEMFQAYSDGVNAYINSLKEPPAEYLALGVSPEPWSPVDSLAIGRAMSYGMSSDVGLEIALGVIEKMIGFKALMKILPIEGVDPTTIIQEGEYSSFPAEDFDERIVRRLGELLPDMGRAPFDTAYGSNNWVVSGSRTDTGNPMLADDTHMGFSLPCDWYEIHLESPELNVTGLSVPGMPGIIVGHNQHVAWGVTQARYDVTDAYVEKLDPERPDTHYMHKDESLPFEVQTIKIKYKTEDGFDEEEHTILNTIHGPVVYEEDRPRAVISFKWTGHQVTHESLAFWGFMTAKNLDDFKKAQEHFEVGALNFVYADVHGDIFYRAPGKVPLRRGKPFLPLDGSSGKYEWQGFIPYDELPQVTNPERGYIVTANNRQAPMDFKYYIGAVYDKGYRARRISDMILAADPMTFAGMQKIQNDVYSLPAENILPLLYEAVDEFGADLTPDAAAALELLRNWDRYDTVDSVEPSIFYTWLKFVTGNIFKDNLPGDVFGKMARSEVVYPFILVNKKLPIDFYDNMGTGDVRETKNMILAHSLNDAVAELAEKLGPDMKEWNWGKIHQVRARHWSGLEEYNLGPEPGPGGTDSVNVATFGLDGGFNYGGGPNMRMVIEMSPDGVKAQNVILGGQSGDLNSPNYSDQFLMWLHGETHPMQSAKEDIDASAQRVMILIPE